MSQFNTDKLIGWIQRKDGISKSQATKIFQRMKNDVKNGSDPKDVLWEEGLEILWEERFIEPDKVADLFK